MWASLYRQVQAAEARLRQAEQNTPPAQTSPTEFAKTPEFAKQQAGQASREEAVLPAAETAAADERKEQLRAISSDLLYWKGGLKVLRQAQLTKWSGSFQWQIEAKIEALQAAYARLRAGVGKRGRIGQRSVLGHLVRVSRQLRICASRQRSVVVRRGSAYVCE